MSKIDDLLKDPRFKQLMSQSPDKAKSLVLEMRQHDFGKIPPAENFLQRAIKQSRSAGQAFGSFMPSNEAEGRDLGRSVLRQITNFSPGLVGEAAKFVDPRRGDVSVPSPETDYGRNLDRSVTTAELAYPVLAGGPKAVRGVGKGVKNFFSTKSAKGELEDLIRSGKDVTKKGIDKFFELKNIEFGKGLNKVKSKMSYDDFASTMRLAADEIGDSGAIGSSADKLAEVAEEIAKSGMFKSGLSSKILTPRKIQFQHKFSG